MKVFLSHSGVRSLQLARFISSWLPVIHPKFETWLDKRDLKAGSHWSPELREALAQCDAGIICVTNETVKADWPLAEFGNLTREKDSVVIPYLVGVTSEALPGPMKQAQVVDADKTGTWKMVQSLAVKAGLDAELDRIKAQFDLQWPILETLVNELREAQDRKKRGCTATIAFTIALMLVVSITALYTNGFRTWLDGASVLWRPPAPPPTKSQSTNFPSPQDTPQLPPPPQITSHQPPIPQLAGKNPDLFGPLRTASTTAKTVEADWGRVATDVRTLQKLDGASVDRQTGQIILHGKHSGEPGPFLLEDLIVALRAAFFELEPPGMTIDENPDDKLGPTMQVRYFGGTANTHIGMAMFEADRLMKCFGQGFDNITKQPLRPQSEGFYTQAEIARELGDAQSRTSWSRFWMNLATGRFPTNDLRGKVVLERSRDGHTISFLEHRVWIDTEQMYDPGPGRRMLSRDGARSTSAEKFAELLTVMFDRIAKEFPIFRELLELSKLIVVAEWIRASGAPIDPELLYYQLNSRSRTPTTTPSLSTTNSWKTAASIESMKMFGGVYLDSTPRYGTPKDPAAKKADLLADVVDRQRSRLQDGNSVLVRQRDATEEISIPTGPLASGPPLAEGATPSPREPTRVIESQDEFRPIAREINDAVLGRFEIPVRTDAATGYDMIDMPLLRVRFDPRMVRSVSFVTEVGAKTTVQIPEQVYLTSPSREISIRFETEAKFDAQRNEAFFPTQAAGVKGYYAKTGKVIMDDGTEYIFDSEGMPTGVGGPNMPTVTITHPAYKDGPCIQIFATPEALPRALERKPLRTMEPRNRAPSVSRNLGVPGANAKTRTAVRNAVTGKSMEVLDDNGRLFYLMQ